jgi:two-component system OmpR family response regulator
MPRVLIVEDDRVIANAMATHLRREGMEVEWSDRGDRAIKKLRFERPDLAIIDLMLPAWTAGASSRRCGTTAWESR